MNYRKGFFVFLLIICISLSISGVFASDLNDTATINGNTLKSDENIHNEISEDGLAIDENNNNETKLKTQENEVLEDSDYNAEIIPLNTVGEYKFGQARFLLYDNNMKAPLANKTVKITFINDINTSFSKLTDEHGIAEFNFEDLYYAYYDSGLVLKTPTVGDWNIKVATKENDIQAKSLDINLAVIPARINMAVTNVDDNYGTSNKLTVRVTSTNTGKAVKNEVFKTFISNTKDKYYYTTTDSNGVISFLLDQLEPGIYSTSTTPNNTANFNFSPAEGQIIINGKAKITLSQTGSTYKSKKLTVNVVSTTTGKAIANQKVKITFSNGKTVPLTTDSAGKASYNIPYAPGTYWAKASATNSMYSFNSPKLSNIKISKVPLTIKANKLSAKYKSKKYFKALVTNSKTKKGVKGVAITLKIYTGKQAKTTTIKTDSYGIVKFSTSKLKAGTHKVTISLKKNKLYSAKAKTSSIKITKPKVKSKSKTKTSTNTATTTATKGKLHTTITIEECYRPSSMAQYYYKITLKDSRGNALANKKIDIKTLVNVFGMGMTLKDSATTNSRGVAEGYVNALMGGVTTFDVTFTYAGDKSYYSSSASKYLG